MIPFGRPSLCDIFGFPLDCPVFRLVNALGRHGVLYRFDDYSLDADRRELRRGGGLVTVEPLVFDIQEWLVRNHDRIVGKDELIARI